MGRGRDLHNAARRNRAELWGSEWNISNPNPEMPAKPEETMGPRQSQEQEEVLVEDITDRPESGREEEDTDAAKSRHIFCGTEKKGIGHHGYYTPLSPRCSHHCG
jgi:hypothetical protein